ncbi:MAG: hypothetical protein WCF85_10595 [Rhodospirillaceae bacterium]
MSEVAITLIEAVQAAGGTIALEGSTIRLEAPAPLSVFLMASLRQYKPVLVAYLAEQAANANAQPPILEPAPVSAPPPSPLSSPEPMPPVEPGSWSAGIPDEVARGIGALFVAPVARDIPVRVWPTIVADTLAFVESGQAARAFALGWSAADLFGCDQHAPWPRIDRAGLALLIGGREISELTADHAALRHRDGTMLRYRRVTTPPEPPVALLWHLLPKSLRPHVGPAP